MTTCKVWFATVMGIVFFTNCSQNKTDQKTEIAIDTQTVLSIGKVNISAYEFDKNRRAKAPSVNQSFGTIQNASTGNWKNDFIDKTYFLADAYDKGYDKNTHIDTIVESAARLMVSQSHGLLQQAMDAEHKVSDEEVKKAIDRSTKVIHIEYLKFKDKTSALNSLQGIALNTQGSFKKLIDKVDLLEVTYKKDVVTWPFNGYWGKEEEIYAIKNDEVLPLLDLPDGYYIIHAEKIHKLTAPAINESVMKVKLEQTQIQRSTELFNKEIYNKAQPVFDNKTITAFSRKLNNYRYGPNHTFLKKDFIDILSKPMLTYKAASGQTTIITVNNFIDHYNILFLKGSIIAFDDVYGTVNNIYFSDYAYREGIKRGITSQPKFLLDKNNYKNNVIYTIYTEQELADKKAITRDEIIQMYNSMKPRLTQAENVVASVYYFNTQREALYKKSNLKSDTLKFKGLIKSDKHLVINYKSKALPDTLKKEIFNISNPSMPARIIALNGQFIVLEKESEKGSRLRSLPEVEDLVIKEIKDQRLLANKKAKLAELKKKYTPKIDLTVGMDSQLAENKTTSSYNLLPY